MLYRLYPTLLNSFSHKLLKSGQICVKAWMLSVGKLYLPDTHKSQRTIYNYLIQTRSRQEGNELKFSFRFYLSKLTSYHPLTSRIIFWAKYGRWRYSQSAKLASFVIKKMFLVIEKCSSLVFCRCLAGIMGSSFCVIEHVTGDGKKQTQFWQVFSSFKFWLKKTAAADRRDLTFGPSWPEM